MMDEGIDWNLTTWEGNRLRQHREFQALPFRRKLEVVEQLGDLARLFTAHRRREASVVREDPRRPTA